MQSSETPGNTLPESLPLVDGLSFTQPDGGDATSVLLENTATNDFYRLGFREVQFIKALQETGSPRAAHSACQERGTGECLSEELAGKLCAWLVANKLVKSLNTSAPTPRTVPLAGCFFWKLPLGDPDRAIKSLVHYVGWLFSPIAIVIGLLCFVVALVGMTGCWRDFFYAYENLVSAQRGVCLLVAWCFLKAIHELWHAGTCRRYGGEVKEAGIALILFMPLAYVNVSTSWRFDSRWKRLHVTLAGVAVECGCAAAALLLWRVSDSPLIEQIAADVLLLASVSSLLFNLNPLLRFDGYFALADITKCDNLYSHGQQYARYFGGRYLLGLNPPSPKLPGKHPGWIKLYGCAAAVYRCFTVCGLLVASAALLEGAGVVLAIAGGLAFIALPLARLAGHLMGSYQQGNLDPYRLFLRLACLASLAVLPCFILPADIGWTVPAVVQYDPPVVLRAHSDGFVDEVHVRDGQRVREGQLVLSLRNDDLTLEHNARQTELAQVEQQLLSAQWTSDSSLAAQLASRKEALLEEVARLQSDVEQLAIHVPNAGVVVAPDLKNIQGVYLKAGEEIAVVGNERAKRLKVSVPQSDAPDLANRIGELAKIWSSGLVFQQSIQRVESRASTVPADEAMLAVNGGSLPSWQDGEKQRLVKPRVNAYINLTPEQAGQLRVGQTAAVALRTNRRSIAQAVSQYLLGMLGF